MRVVCLHFLHGCPSHVAELFLKFSPQIQYRPPHFIFLDITQTTHLFASEEELLDKILTLAEQFQGVASAAIANTPYSAQLFSQYENQFISDPLNEREQIEELPIASLQDMEGLLPWKEPRRVQGLIAFFGLLGIQKIGELSQVSFEQLHQRWGTLGDDILKRLRLLEKQVISPLLPTESLVQSKCFDFPVSLTAFLLHEIELTLKPLFYRLYARGQFAQSIQLRFLYEYSDAEAVYTFEPSSPHRELSLFLDLIELRLENIRLENPVREIILSISPVPEKQEQLDFFDSTSQDEGKLLGLLSLLKQSEITSGFLTYQEEFLPEDSWQIRSIYTPFEWSQDQVEIEAEALRLKPAYSAALARAPRPVRLLKSPQRLSLQEVKRLRFLSDFPLERIESHWWNEKQERDYYAAVGQKGERLWLYQDTLSQEYFLHGYFD